MHAPDDGQPGLLASLYESFLVVSILNLNTFSWIYFQLIVLMDPNEETDDILRANRSREKHYVFDMVFNPDATQEDMYRLVEEKNMIDNVLSGFNCAVFAYGATGVCWGSFLIQNLLKSNFLIRNHDIEY